jgi:acyl carrier protein
MQNSIELSAIEEIVRRFAPKQRTNVTIATETKLADELGIDSPRMIDIVLEVEDRFGISLEDVDVDKTATVGDLLLAVELRRRAAAV